VNDRAQESVPHRLRRLRSSVSSIVASRSVSAGGGGGRCRLRLRTAVFSRLTALCIVASSGGGGRCRVTASHLGLYSGDVLGSHVLCHVGGEVKPQREFDPVVFLLLAHPAPVVPDLVEGERVSFRL
jgi:hypothetical protein